MALRWHSDGPRMALRRPFHLQHVDPIATLVVVDGLKQHRAPRREAELDEVWSAAEGRVRNARSNRQPSSAAISCNRSHMAWTGERQGQPAAISSNQSSSAAIRRDGSHLNTEGWSARTPTRFRSSSPSGVRAVINIDAKSEPRRAASRQMACSRGSAQKRSKALGSNQKQSESVEGVLRGAQEVSDGALKHSGSDRRGPRRHSAGNQAAAWAAVGSH